MADAFGFGPALGSTLGFLNLLSTTLFLGCLAGAFNLLIRGWRYSGETWERQNYRHAPEVGP